MPCIPLQAVDPTFPPTCLRTLFKGTWRTVSDRNTLCISLIRYVYDQEHAGRLEVHASQRSMNAMNLPGYATQFMYRKVLPFVEMMVHDGWSERFYFYEGTKVPYSHIRSGQGTSEGMKQNSGRNIMDFRNANAARKFSALPCFLLHYLPIVNLLHLFEVVANFCCPCSHVLIRSSFWRT